MTGQRQNNCRIRLNQAEVPSYCLLRCFKSGDIFSKNFFLNSYKIIKKEINVEEFLFYESEILADKEASIKPEEIICYKD